MKAEYSAVFLSNRTKMGQLPKDMPKWNHNGTSISPLEAFLPQAGMGQELDTNLPQPGHTSRWFAL